MEDKNGEPYFYRNVMKKVATKKQKETLASRAENIKQKLFLGDETMEFLEYVDSEDMKLNYPIGPSLPFIKTRNVI